MATRVVIQIICLISMLTDISPLAAVDFGERLPGDGPGSGIDAAIRDRLAAIAHAAELEYSDVELVAELTPNNMETAVNDEIESLSLFLLGIELSASMDLEKSHQRDVVTIRPTSVSSSNFVSITSQVAEGWTGAGYYILEVVFRDPSHSGSVGIWSFSANPFGRDPEVVDFSADDGRVLLYSEPLQVERTPDGESTGINKLVGITGEIDYLQIKFKGVRLYRFN